MPNFDSTLLSVLACPDTDHAPLLPTEAGLVCSGCGRRYDVVDGIPVLLLEPGDA
ncbi:Trm112 family protein [Cryptosporangium sp. NPDC051539]|uniref:Trm112 family protein n=1 Tax=Cryptosporangium sp. NPDC051539 TaxID=3363962 RepID=UPI0037A283D8